MSTAIASGQESVAVGFPDTSGLPRIERGRYRARPALSDRDVARARDLRALRFRAGGTGDTDEFDARCGHILIEDRGDGALACCFRMLQFDGPGAVTGYSARFYGLGALRGFDRPILEIGRFCVDPARRDPDVLRVALAAIAQITERRGIGLLIGCSSFAGTDPAPYRDCFARLRARHLAPRHWQPEVLAGEVYPFAHDLAGCPDPGRATPMMPPLLRSYLALGGWVSDHAVVDHQLGTLHVFTGVETRAVPERRKRLLRALA